MEPRRKKGPICGVENCRSRKYDEGEDGYLYCENGHRKGNLVIGQDEDNFTSSARTTTRRKRDDEGKASVQKQFQGQQAVELYLQSVQLILRHQLWFLIKTKGLPAELETVVFDLWALRISQLEDQLAESQGHESQSQLFSTAGSEDESDSKATLNRPPGNNLKSLPTLRDALSLCYLGVITLRLPITPGDIREWATNEKLPYKKAIKLLPIAMRDRLPAYYHNALDPNSLLTFERFYSATTELQSNYHKEFGIVWPKLNHPLLLFRYLKELALPLEIYDATIRLAGYLGFDFTPSLNDKGKKLGVIYLAEAQLIACLVVCVKLFYPFDDLRRHPKTASEPAATTIDWDEWYKQISAAKPTHGNYEPEQLAHVTEKDVFTMSGKQLDQYLDWYQDNFIDEEKLEQSGDEYRTALWKMFPIDGPPRQDKTQGGGPEQKDALGVVRAVHESTRPKRVIHEGDEKPDTLRPGDKYQYYRKEEDLPERARRFYELAAKTAGLSLDMLVMAVFFTEKRVEKWKAQQAQTQ